MTLRKQVLSELGNPTLGDKLKVPKQALEGKTDRMLRLEIEHGGVDIRDLIKEGTVRDVSIRLGINFGTVSLWRRSLSLSDGKGMSGHQMHQESCGPDCHAVSLGRCYAPSCKHPTCGCWHAEAPSDLCTSCSLQNTFELKPNWHEGCICLQ